MSEPDDATNDLFFIVLELFPITLIRIGNILLLDILKIIFICIILLFVLNLQPNIKVTLIKEYNINKIELKITNIV